MFRALIVDDERLARAKLHGMLEQHTDLVTVVGEADSIAAAVALVEDEQPDVVFLDIQLPGESGFDLLHRTEAAFRVVFVTAFDQHAIRAFEVNALDYLLKPVSPARLRSALERLAADPDDEDEQPDATAPLTYEDHLFLAAADRPRFVQVSQLVCIEAAGAYTTLRLAGGAQVLVQQSMHVWEARLPAAYFARIHRSTIINLSAVERVDKWYNYAFRVHLRGLDEPLTMSRRYAARLKNK
jgi:two-component system LytT family response regulator